MRINFSPNGKIVVTGSVDGTTRIWDVQSGNEQQKLGVISPTLSDNIISDEAVLSVSYSSDGKTIVTGHQDGTLRVYMVLP